MMESVNVDGKKMIVRDYIFTWSNLFSVSRILVAFPIIYIHYNHNLEVNIWITLLIVYGILSDYLDGFVARLRNEITELGKVLDPIADKVMAFILFLYTVWLGWIPLWFFALGVIRDLFIMAGSAHIKKVRGKVAMSVMSGKICVNFLALYWMVVFFIREAEWLHQLLMYSTVIMMIISFIAYYIRYKKIINGAEFN